MLPLTYIITPTFKFSHKNRLLIILVNENSHVLSFTAAGEFIFPLSFVGDKISKFPKFGEP